VLGDVRENVGNFHPALSVAGKVVLGTHAGECLALELGELLALGERSGHRLAVELAEFRFEIESLQMGRAAGHAEKNDTLHLGWQLGRQPESGLSA
jgi:hypothetical protein